MEIPFFPVLWQSRRVVADAFGEGVPEEIEPREEVEIGHDPVGVRVEFGVGSPFGEGIFPRAFLEEPLNLGPLVVGVADDFGVVVLVGVDLVEFGRLGDVDV